MSDSLEEERKDLSKRLADYIILRLRGRMMYWEDCDRIVEALKLCRKELNDNRRPS